MRQYSIAVLNSYSVIFFSQDKLFGGIILLVSFFNPVAGSAGLLAVMLTQAVARFTGFSKECTSQGLYSFNALLTAIGLATIYEQNAYFWLVLLLSAFCTFILSITVSAWLGKYGLPVLSLPFVLTFWMISLTGDKLVKITTLSDSDFWQPASVYLNNHFNTLIQAYPLSLILNFFRSISAVLFQDNAFAGFLLSLGFIWYSRIGFSLLLIGFFTAYGIERFSTDYHESINYYNFGANYMMTAVALGAFFIIPSRYSYLWSVLSIALAGMLVKGLTNLLKIYELPVLSLPFSVVVILMLYFFMQRISSRGLTLTPVQNFSPELNLYQFLNNRERLQNHRYVPLLLPFIGEWTVSQGYEGNITHKGDWSKALDFVILDNEMKTYAWPGSTAKDFYCYNKPVLACATGFVEDVIDDIEDNPIGEVDTVNNWGNTIIIRHLTGLYSKVSHLKKGSAKVKKGDFVYQGDVIGACGNSGRSPEPHLHFQVQQTPYIGSKTTEYPFSYYFNISETLPQQLQSFTIPAEGQTIANPAIDFSIKMSFTFQPGFRVKFTNYETGKTEEWEVFTDALNQSFFHLKDSTTSAYFTDNESAFYFSNFYGDKNTLLYQFYLSAYKVIFTSVEGIQNQDIYPLHLSRFKSWLWLQDFIAPFNQFITFKFKSNICKDDKQPQQMSLKSEQYIEYFGKVKEVMKSEIKLINGRISTLEIQLPNKPTASVWTLES
ncbi:MAG: urea transporter [Sphingobacteriaceae bacterium]|nr:urea transporter [Sphingobacteriaceae bacterium]